MSDRVMKADRALISAFGKTLALVAALRERGGLVSAREFGNILGMFAVTVAETDPDEGDILAFWAGIVKKAAAHTMRSQ